MHIVSGLLLLAGCITPKKGPRKAYADAASFIPFDAIIVPGIPYNGRNWDSTMKARVLWSYILYKRGYTKNVIYSGGAIYTPYIEAKVMGEYGKALGIPAEDIYYDTAAKHSTENVYNSYLLAKNLGFKKLALATDPFQSFMLRGFTRRRFSSPIYLIPFVVDSLAVYNNLNPQLELGHLKQGKSWVSIKDQEGFGQRIKGTLGRGIDWNQYPGGKVPAL